MNSRSSAASFHARHTAWFNAVATGNARKFDRMAAAGLDPNATSNRRHGARSLLQTAMEAGSRVMIERLVAAGARPGWREWAVAVRLGDAWASEQASWWPNAQSSWPDAPHRAHGLASALASAPDAATARRLLSWGAPTAATRCPGQRGGGAVSPLKEAVTRHRLDVTAVLLEAGAAAQEGLVAMREASRAILYARPASTALLRLLLDAGASPSAVDEGFPARETLLGRWASDRMVGGVRLLLAHGARPIEGRPCTAEARRSERLAAMGTLEWVLDQTERWMDSGTDRQDAETVVELLLAHGASLDDPSSHTAFETIRQWARATLPQWRARWDEAGLTNACPAGRRLPPGRRL